MSQLPAAPVGASRLSVSPGEVPARFEGLLERLLRERRYGGAAADVTELLRRFPRWAKAYRSEDGAARPADGAVRVLRDAGLTRSSRGCVLARPAACRYRVRETASPAPENDPEGTTASSGIAAEGDMQ